MDKREVSSFIQIQRIGDKDSSIKSGNNESYIFVVLANSALHFNVGFVLKNDLSLDNKKFNEIIFLYFDRKIKSMHYIL